MIQWWWVIVAAIIGGSVGVVLGAIFAAAGFDDIIRDQEWE